MFFLNNNNNNKMQCIVYEMNNVPLGIRTALYERENKKTKKGLHGTHIIHAPLLLG